MDLSSGWNGLPTLPPEAELGSQAGVMAALEKVSLQLG